jgi:glycerol-1-phosphate dehydrogenase [NAD(P)+]
MELPREVLVGHDALMSVGTICSKLKLKGPALIISDPTTKQIAGESVQDIMKAEKYKMDLETIEGATISEVARITEHLKKGKFKLVLGVGGGRPIDVAKLSSFKLDIPYISVPTAASHDGIVSNRASISVDDRKKSYDAHTPFALIADTGIIAKAPMKITASGCGDVISNVTAVRDWDLAHKKLNVEFSTYASTLSKMTAFVIEKYAEIIAAGGEECAWHVIKAQVASGVAMSIAGSSRPCSGSEHMFSHRLDATAPKPALHGEQCAVGTIMMMKLHDGDWENIRDVLKKIGTPTTAKDLGIEPEFIIQALTEANTVRPDRYTILGDGITKGVATELAEVTGVI